MVHVPAFAAPANPYAEPGELINLAPIRPRIRIRFGIWCCSTPRPFAVGSGYKPADAYEDWARLIEEQRLS